MGNCPQQLQQQQQQQQQLQQHRQQILLPLTGRLTLLLMILCWAALVRGVMLTLCQQRPAQRSSRHWTCCSSSNSWKRKQTWQGHSTSASSNKK
jgi:hypothetical protein